MKRGEVWLINLDPTIGAEIRKTRPAIIVNDDQFGILPLKVIVPLTDWKDKVTSVDSTIENINYSGEYSYLKVYDQGLSDSGTIIIKQTAKDEINFDLSVSNYQAHVGDITNGKAKLNGNVAVYEQKEKFRDEACRLEITFTGNSATIKTVDTKYCDASCGFGMNVCADGVYIKKIGSNPGDFTKFADYVPFGWQILAKEDGDLNKDGIADAVLVIHDGPR